MQDPTDSDQYQNSFYLNDPLDTLIEADNDLRHKSKSKAKGKRWASPKESSHSRKHSSRGDEIIAQLSGDWSKMRRYFDRKLAQLNKESGDHSASSRPHVIQDLME